MIEDILPLAPLQEGLLFHSLFDPKEQDDYLVQFVIDLQGPLLEEALENAAKALLQRHVSLRAGFVHLGLKQPVQIITKDIVLPWKMIDLRSSSNRYQQEQFAQFLSEDRRCRFDLEHAPLLRFTLVRLDVEHSLLVLTTHHLIIDGWSLQILFQELFDIYKNGSDWGGLRKVTPYKKYMSWLAAQDREASLSAWLIQLAELDDGTCLAADAGTSHEASGVVTRELTSALTRTLVSNARALSLTLSTIFQAAWGIVLSRLTKRDDVVFGITVAGRPPEIPGVDGMVGLFSNTLPLRMRLRSYDTLRDTLRVLQDTQSHLQLHQYVSLGDIQKHFGRGRLFDTLAAFENYPIQLNTQERRGGALQVRYVQARTSTHYPLSLAAVPGECLSLRLDYNVRKFERQEVESMAHRLTCVLEHVAENPNKLLGRIDLNSSEERLRVLGNGNLKLTNGTERTLVDLFQAQVEKTPEAIALASEDESLTYRELNRRANGLARKLICLNVGPEQLVVVALGSSMQAVIALLGVIKAGAAYLFLDTEAQPAISRSIMSIVRGAKLILSTQRFEKETDSVVSLRDLDTSAIPEWDLARDPSNSERTCPLDPAHPACVIYTSESTGTAKPVVMTHAAITCYAPPRESLAGLRPGARVLHSSSANADVFTTELLLALTTGSALILLSDQSQRRASTREALPATHSVLPPMTLAKLIEFQGNERIPLDFLIERKDAFHGTQLTKEPVADRKTITVCGPTEVNIGVMVSRRLSRSDEPSIWAPLENTEVYILDDNLHPTSTNECGELYIAGVGLARGYLNGASLTAERFVANPYGAPGTRIYRTRDLARWRADGSVELLGRTELQAFPDVEAALLLESSIKECLVLARGSSIFGSRLVAYIVSTAFDVAERLDKHLRTALPELINPVVYVPVKTIPLLANGKVDRRALSSLEVIDSRLQRRWEAALSAVPEIERVAVVITSDSERLSRLQIADLIPPAEENLVKENAHTLTTTSIRATPRTSSLASPRLALGDGGPLPEDDSAPKTLSESIERTVLRFPSKGITYVEADGSESFHSYPDLMKRSQCILSGLRMTGIRPNDKVIFQLERNQDVIPCFWACVLGGFVPVPIAVPSSYDVANSSLSIFQHALRMFDRRIVLTSVALETALHRLSCRSEFEGLTVATVDTLYSCGPAADRHVCEPDDVVLILLTSGSTGKPKGVQLSHRNLLSHICGFAALNGISSSDLSLNWLPLDHVGGLVNFHARDVYLGCQQVQIASSVVLGNPIKWLDYSSEYRSSNTWGPNFIFGLLNGLAKQFSNKQWDLSALRVLINGGEMIVAQTAKMFMELMEPFGLQFNAMRPGWGMSETSAGLTYSDGLYQHTINGTDSFVEVGKPVPGALIRIVDAHDNLVEEHQIGHLHVKGPSVTRGYYQRPDLNDEVFHNGGWFETGDLGFISDGRLTITGRDKEEIRVNGVNYYLHEIEAAVEEVKGVDASCVAACGVRASNANTDQLALFFSAEIATEAILADLIRTIRRRVLEKCGVAVQYLIPVNKTDIPRTSIGKIQHRHLVDRFRNGEFDEILSKVDIICDRTKTLPDWFYRVRWHRKEPVTIARGDCRGVIVFMDELGLGAALARIADQQKVPTVIVEYGCEFIKHDSRYYTIDPDSEQNYGLLFRNMLEDAVQWDVVLHLWSYRKYSSDDAYSSDSLKESLDIGVGGLLLLVQAMARIEKLEPSRRLYVVSSHSCAVQKEDEVGCDRGAIIGLLKTVGQEVEAIQCRHFDMPTSEIEVQAERLWRELKVLDRDVEIAYRGHQRFARRLEKMDIIGAERLENVLKSGGLYVISGGLGGIALELSRWLIERYGARLLLLGRTILGGTLDSGDAPVDASIKRRIEAMKAISSQGAWVRYAAVDVTDSIALKRAVEGVESDWGREIDGVFHLAGIFQDRQILQETSGGLVEALRPKLYGALALHDILKDRSNALFVSFSSVNGFFGAFGASSYSAANSALESFCTWQRRQAPAIRSYCFSWSMWNEVGMSHGYAMKELTRTRGYQLIELEEGINSLMVGLCRNEPHLLIGLHEKNCLGPSPTRSGPLVGQRLYAYVTSKVRPFPLDTLRKLQVFDSFNIRSTCQFEQLTEMPLLSTGEIDRSELEGLHGTYTREYVGPRSELEKKIADIWIAVLDRKRISITDNFFAIGGHSLAAMQVVARTKTAFEISIPVRRFFEAPTIEELAHVVEDMLLEEIEQLPEHEAIRLVNK